MKYSNKLLIILTKECNRNCKFCIDKPNKKYYNEDINFIDINTVKKIIEFAKANNIKTIALNGGEPTLHPQIVKIAKLIKENGFTLKLFTNYDFPEVVKKLDGIVDIIRISYYGPMNLPEQKDFKSKITLKITLTKETFPTIEELVEFINKNRNKFNDIKIHTLMQNNEYSITHQVDYLNYLNNNFPLKRNEKGDYYHEFVGTTIEREDIPNLDYDIEQRIFKAHMDGTISHYFEEEHHELDNLEQNKIYTKVLRAHRNSIYRKNVTEAYKNNCLDPNNCDKYLPKY